MSHRLRSHLFGEHTVLCKRHNVSFMKLLILYTNYYIFKNEFVLYVYECFACMSACAPCRVCRGQKGIRSPRTGITGTYEQPCWCWDFSLGSLEEWSLFLTTKPTLQFLRLKYFEIASVTEAEKREVIFSLCWGRKEASERVFISAQLCHCGDKSLLTSPLLPFKPYQFVCLGLKITCTLLSHWFSESPLGSNGDCVSYFWTEISNALLRLIRV